jgi:3-phenylpropionate/trans-cinnamate dioxygenase ferredoxin reductase subunit
MGFIGCEVAATLHGLGVEVAAVETFAVPLERVLGEEVGRTIAELHRDHGVETILGEAVAALEGNGRVEQVRTASGRVLECDFAVVGLGIEPAVDVVAGTGVELDDGILVDELCRTTVDGIYAAGDDAIEQGQAAARSMLGKGVPYDNVHWFWSDQYDENLQYTGHHTSWDELVVRGSLAEREFVAFYVEGGVVRAAVALNRGRDLRRAQGLIRSGVRVDPAQLRDPEVDLRTLAPPRDGGG